MDNYYRLGTIRKPELMAKQWVEKLVDAEKKSLMSQYVALEKEDTVRVTALDAGVVLDRLAVRRLQK